MDLDRETVFHLIRLGGYISRHFNFVRDAMEPGKTSGNIEFTPNRDAEQQKSLAEEIINFRGSQEYEVESAFSEDANSEMQDPAQNANMRAPKRKRG